MKQRCVFLAMILVLSLVLGAASVREDGQFRGVIPALGHGAILLAAMVVFLQILPRRCSLPVQIFIAMVIGVAAGWGLAAANHVTFVTDYVAIFGRLFILLLKLVIIPLIFVSIVCGVAGIGDVRKLGPLGAKTLGFYFCTTGVAVLIGLACVNIIQPGAGREALQEDARQIQEANEDETPSLGLRIQQDILPTIIRNPIMAGQNPLVVIFFALLLGAALATIGDEAEPALRVFRAFDKAFITLVLWIMVLAPLGVFALMCKAIATLGLDYVATLAKYCFTVVLALGLHFALLVGVIVPVLGRISPMRFLRGMAPALQLSFSTSSSSATLPVTIDCASRRVGADQNVCSFMLPIGATINMDGTALYTAVASLFIAQVYGVELTLAQQLMVFATAVVVSVGTAGIPGASLALMTIILGAVNLPVEGIGIILGVDRFLDMCRTTVNITGDSVGAVVVSRSEGVMKPAPEG